MLKYEHLFFDLDNTLWDFDTNSKLAMQQTLQEFNVNEQLVPFDTFHSYYQQINESLWQAYRNKQITKANLIKTRFEKPLEKFCIENIDPLSMNDCYLALMPKQTQLIEGVTETLDYLQSKGYKMHIITNGFKQVQHQKIETSRLSKYFKWIFISEEIQAPKPDKRIFQHALRNCNAKKSKSIMIGDSWESDIIGASNFGIDQAFFQNNNKNIPPDNAIKTKMTKNTSILTLTPSLITYSVIKFKTLCEIF